MSLYYGYYEDEDCSCLCEECRKKEKAVGPQPSMDFEHIEETKSRKTKTKPTANLDKAKKRFRTAAWWCFGLAAGLIGGKIYVDLGIYFGLPAKAPASPMKFWVYGVWSAAVALYVFLYAALWVAATAIRRKLKVNTSYDVTMGDVRIIKVNPEMHALLTYQPEMQPLQIEAAKEKTE